LALRTSTTVQPSTVYGAAGSCDTPASNCGAYSSNSLPILSATPMEPWIVSCPVV
jgi:hypothetical protein